MIKYTKKNIIYFSFFLQFKPAHAILGHTDVFSLLFPTSKTKLVASIHFGTI